MNSEFCQILVGFFSYLFDEGRLPPNFSPQNFEINLKGTQFYKIDLVGEEDSSS